MVTGGRVSDETPPSAVALIRPSQPTALSIEQRAGNRSRVDPRTAAVGGVNAFVAGSHHDPATMGDEVVLGYVY